MADTKAPYSPLNERPIANTICLFDVDGTLTLARRVSTLSNYISSLAKPPPSASRL